MSTMLAQFVKQGTYSTFMYGASAVFARLLNFALFPYIVHTIGISAYGIWDFYQTIFYFSSSMLASCASSALIRFYLADTRPDYQQKVLGTSCWLLVATLCAWFLAGSCALWLFPQYTTLYVILTLCNSSLQAMLYFVLAYYKSTNAVFLHACLFNMQQLIMLFLMRSFLPWCTTTVIPLFTAVTISLFCILPWFLYLFSRNFTCDYTLLKQQLRFSIPLLLVGISTVCFISVDRYFLKLCSYELLGHYAILTRFGSLFQFCALALTDAWPVIIFTACRTDKPQTLVPQLTTYYIFVLMTLAVCMNGISLLIFSFLFPDLYPHLACYIPFIFCAAMLYETARVLQASFTITYQTMLSAFLAYITLILQSIGCWLATTTNTVLAALIGANCLSFLWYAVSSFICVHYYAPTYQVIPHRIILFGLTAVAYMLATHVSIMYCSWYALLLLVLSWPLILWLVIAREQEKQWCITLYQHYVDVMLKRTYPELVYTDAPYYEHIQHERIALFGVYPPPWGGISVHIARIQKMFVTQNNHVACFDTERLRARMIIKQLYQMVTFLRTQRPTKMYYHSPYIRLSFVHIFLLGIARFIYKSQLILVEHNCRYLYQRSRIFRLLYTISLRCVDEIIFIGKPTYDSYCAHQMYIPTVRSIRGAFIPPDTTQRQTILRSYPKGLYACMQKSTPCITGNASNVLKVNDYDLYGIDMMILLVAALRTTYPTIGCVYAISNFSDQQYWQYLQTLVVQHAVQDHIYFLTGTYQYWPIIEQADLFVRPTRNENFGISVAEALYFHIPAVASDVCTRPAGTTLFKTGDQEDLLRTCQTILGSLNIQSKNDQGISTL